MSDLGTEEWWTDFVGTYGVAAVQPGPIMISNKTIIVNDKPVKSERIDLFNTFRPNPLFPNQASSAALALSDARVSLYAKYRLALTANRRDIEERTKKYTGAKVKRTSSLRNKRHLDATVHQKEPQNIGPEPSYYSTFLAILQRYRQPLHLETITEFTPLHLILWYTTILPNPPIIDAERFLECVIYANAKKDFFELNFEARGLIRAVRRGWELLNDSEGPEVEIDIGDALPDEGDQARVTLFLENRLALIRKRQNIVPDRDVTEMWEEFKVHSEELWSEQKMLTRDEFDAGVRYCSDNAQFVQ
jgi:hypothetical protein